MSRPMGLVKDLPFADYLAIDAFSNSDMTLLARSAWHWKNRLPKTQTQAMLRGSLAHCAQLEPHALNDRYVFVPEDAPRRPTEAQWNAAKSNESSMQAKEWWKTFLDGVGSREIVTAADFAITQMQLQALAADEDLAYLLTGEGYCECSVFWVDAETGVYCKARPDRVRLISDRRARLLDLKSTMDESPSGFGRAAARLGYHRQAAHYTEGFAVATSMKVEAFVFGAVTSAPPVLAVPYILTDAIAEQAADERRELLELYARCKKDDHYPAYGTGYQLLDFPAWASRSSEVEVSFVE